MKHGKKDLCKTEGPPARLDEAQLEELAELSALQCTGEECAASLGLSLEGLERSLKAAGKQGFAPYHDRGQKMGCIALRRAQYEAALKGNAQMLIWLGKQWLGQCDARRGAQAGGGGDSPPENPAPALDLSKLSDAALREIAALDADL